jgi:hypothetical protein
MEATMSTATQEAKNKCSICGKTFDTVEEARLHEKNCTFRDRVAGTPRSETPEEEKIDAEIEDRFEATDN